MDISHSLNQNQSGSARGHEVYPVSEFENRTVFRGYQTTTVDEQAAC